MQTKDEWAVDIFEYERGYGSRVDETETFPTFTEAENFTKKFNSQNTEKTVPDWYMVAGEPYRIT